MNSPPEPHFSMSLTILKSLIPQANLRELIFFSRDNNPLGYEGGENLQGNV